MARLHTQRGVTLIELMVVTTILGILGAVAAPSFLDFIARNRIDAAANDALTSVNYARSEAIKRGTIVALCRSTNGTSCATTGDWEQGWIAFVDGNASGTVDGGEAVLQRWQALPQGYTLRGSTTVSASVRYNARGLANASGHWIVCRNSATAGAKAIVFTTTRPRMATDSNNDRIPENDTGNNFTTCTP